MALSTIGNPGAPTAASLPAAPQGAAASAGKAPAAVPAPTPQQSSAEHARRTVESIKQLVQEKAPNSLSFSIDDSTGKTIVRVSDAQTGEMIRQIPSEELLEIARSLDRMQGLMLKDQA